jgi:spermidine synthase
MISPYAAKLRLQNSEHSGETVGILYAISTLGSIAGTFLAGFFLIAYFGSNYIVTILSLVLIPLAVLMHPRWVKGASVILIVLGLLNIFWLRLEKNNFQKEGRIDLDTAFSRYTITEKVDPITLRRTRSLTTSPRLETQSVMFLDDPNELVVEYTQFYRLGEEFAPGFKKALMIGGGAYSFPKFFLANYPDATLDVVEIDGELPAVAQKFFSLKESSRMRLIAEDGRTFLNRNQEKYDVIYIDAFHNLYSIPFHLTTQEAIKKIQSQLSDNGVVILNLISAIEGERGRFFQAEYATYRSVFPEVAVFPVQFPKSSTAIQNIMLVAFQTESSWAGKKDYQLKELVANQWKGKIDTGGLLLTDDFAPTDQFLSQALKSQGR